MAPEPSGVVEVLNFEIGVLEAELGHLTTLRSHLLGMLGETGSLIHDLSGRLDALHRELEAL